jgi:hypothetical protein
MLMNDGGRPELAEEAHRVLPDPVEYSRFLTRFGIPKTS